MSVVHLESNISFVMDVSDEHKACWRLSQREQIQEAVEKIHRLSYSPWTYALELSPSILDDIIEFILRKLRTKVRYNPLKDTLEKITPADRANVLSVEGHVDTRPPHAACKHDDTETIKHILGLVTFLQQQRGDPLTVEEWIHSGSLR